MKALTLISPFLLALSAWTPKASAEYSPLALLLFPQMESMTVGDCELRTEFDRSEPFGTSVTMNLWVKQVPVLEKPIRLHYTQYTFDARNSFNVLNVLDSNRERLYGRWMQLKGSDVASDLRMTAWRGYLHPWGTSPNQHEVTTWMDFEVKTYGVGQFAGRRGYETYRNTWSPINRVNITCIPGKPVRYN